MREIESNLLVRHTFAFPNRNAWSIFRDGDIEPVRCSSHAQVADLESQVSDSTRNCDGRGARIACKLSGLGQGARTLCVCVQCKSKCSSWCRRKRSTCFTCLHVLITDNLSTKHPWLTGLEQQLKVAENQVQQTQAQLKQAQEALAACKDQLQVTRAGHQNTQNVVREAQNEMGRVTQELQSAQGELQRAKELQVGATNSCLLVVLNCSSDHQRTSMHC